MKVSHAVVAGLMAAGLAGCAGTTDAPASNAPWTTLVDGATFANWERVGNANWTVTEGSFYADKGSGFLVSQKSYGDFEIRAEFWADAESNSGIFIRCQDRQKLTAATCYEVNIYDQRPGPEYGTGAIVDVAKVSPMPKAGGRWNTFEVTAKGDHLVVKLNGVKTVDVRDAKLARGAIGLQFAPGVVKDKGTIKFRNVRVREL